MNLFLLLAASEMKAASLEGAGANCMDYLFISLFVCCFVFSDLVWLENLQVFFSALRHLFIAKWCVCVILVSCLCMVLSVHKS